jgi:hypothetical protein
MALLKDGAVASIEDLRAYDTQLLDVATVEGIDVTRKLALAQEELCVEVEGLLGQAMLSGPLNTSPGIGQVVVTPPLKLWNIFRTLELVYRDAYNSQLNDRYAGKRNEYHEMAKWAHDQVVQSGIGIASDPVEQAATPEVRPAAGGLADGTYYIAAAWTNAAGEEGGSSTPTMIQVTGSSFTVQTTAPPNVKGWTVYCGTSPATMTMQNGTDLSPGQTWVQPDTLSTTRRPTGTGQSPTYRLPVSRTIQRG